MIKITDEFLITLGLSEEESKILTSYIIFDQNKEKQYKFIDELENGQLFIDKDDLCIFFFNVIPKDKEQSNRYYFLRCISDEEAYNRYQIKLDTIIYRPESNKRRQVEIIPLKTDRFKTS